MTPGRDTIVDELTALIERVRPAWHRDAAFPEHPELNWFPGHGQTFDRELEVCRAYLVRDDCAAEAIADASMHGIWGATTAPARKRLRRDERNVIPAESTTVPPTAC